VYQEKTTDPSAVGLIGEGNRSTGENVSLTNKTDHHNITEILLKVALNTINLNPNLY
jgi:hypothetical protein